MEELLDFSNDDDAVIGDGGGLFYNNNNNGNNNSTECSAVTVIESCNSSSFLEDISGSNLTDAHFSSELCVPVISKPRLFLPFFLFFPRTFNIYLVLKKGLSIQTFFFFF